MAKTLRDITGTNASKVVKLNHKDMYQWNSPDGIKFVDDKHPVQKHEDRVGNGDDVYKGKTKEASYKKQSDGVYEEAEQIDEGGNRENKAKKNAVMPREQKTVSFKEVMDKAIQKRKNKHKIANEEVELEEASKEKLIKYVKANHAEKRAEDEANKKTQSFPDAIDATKRPSKKTVKRNKGRVLALDKLNGDAKVNATEETDANITNQKLGAGEKKTALLSFHECGDGCNNTGKGMKCEVHGLDECPGWKDKKGRKLLMDKKQACEGIEIGKALRVGNQFTDTHLAKEKRNPANLGKPADLIHKANKTIGKLKGSTFLVKKLTENEHLNEISMKVLGSYIKKATAEMEKIAKKDPMKSTFKDTDKYYDRAKGVEKAKDKLN